MNPGHAGGGRSRYARAGFALPLVLLCLLAVSLSLTALLSLALMEERGAAARVGVVRAEGEAERNAVRAITTWTRADLTAFPVGSTRTTVSGVMEVRRLTPGLFLFSGSSTVPPGIYRTRSLLIGLRPPGVGLQRALTSPGAVHLSTGALVTEPPPGSRSCDRADSAAAGWVPQTSFAGPREDPAGWAARAEVLLPGGTVITPAPRYSSGTCIMTDPSNWGDPGGATACARYGPVVRVTGDASVTGGVGQGVLVVDGDLVVRGGLRYDGLVLIGGRLEITGAGADFRGAVQVADGSGQGSPIGTGGRITYSTCILDETTRRFGRWRSTSGGRWLGATK